MQRQIIPTADGSHTVSIPGMKVTYHSIHGALQESMHVFIVAGLRELLSRIQPGGPVHILEVGLGTGLNALLSLVETETAGFSILYTAMEPFPLLAEEYSGLNYCATMGRPDLQPVFQAIHESKWEISTILLPRFSLLKTRRPLLEYSGTGRFELVYFDAFAPASQPELWTVAIFKKLYEWMETNGILVTYCSKGDVRRALQEAGFSIEKIPGPPGKREMLRATRL